MDGRSYMLSQRRNVMMKRIVVVAVVAGLVGAWGVAPASAYMCEGLIKAAEDRIKEAEGKIKPDTDVRIKQKLVEAKGILESAKVGHRQATERHTGPVGKYSHGDSVRQARWAESLASEVVFLATGEAR
jgi:hypothetical protein